MSDASLITLAHGNGGRFMRELIETVFVRHLGNPDLDTRADAVRLALPPGDVVVTTDGFSVQPLEFPGGDIGSLAVHGTINDLAVAGAIPHFLTLSAFIEEGLPFQRLDRIVRSLARASAEAGVRVVAGDTKVVPRGQGGGLYLATTGVGVRRPQVTLGLDRVRAGDRILVSGPVGDHGTAVLLAREEFGLRGDIESDSASVVALAQTLLDLPGIRFMRDPTRGGIATVMHEVASATGFGVRLDEPAIPVRDPVRALCAILGYDPMFLACEGRVVALVAESDASEALARWRRRPDGNLSAIVGTIMLGDPHVVLSTELGGERIIDELEDDPLPRIC